LGRGGQELAGWAPTAPSARRLVPLGLVTERPGRGRVGL